MCVGAFVCEGACVGVCVCACLGACVGGCVDVGGWVWVGV